MILYIETNYIVGTAKGREIHLDDLFNIPTTRLRIALPSICLMEAWSVFEGEGKRRKDFAQQLQAQISDLRRDLSSNHARSLLSHLEQARIDNNNVLNDTESRIRGILAAIAGEKRDNRVELVGLDSNGLRNSRLFDK